MLRLRNLLLGCAGLLLPITTTAIAQDYPTKPVRMVLPFAPGGSTDLIARMVAAQLTERMGKQFAVDNRAGAGGIVGTDIVRTAAPDGYTLLVVSMAHATNPHLHKLDYQLTKAFMPIAIFGSAASALLVHPSVPVNSVKELIALDKAKPGTLNIGHAGPGSFQHLAVAQFNWRAGTKMTEVAFKGGGPALIDLLGGHSQALVGAIISALPHIRAGKLKALATSDSTRHPLLPDLPTIAEAGVKDYLAVNWFGLAAPAGTPQPIVDKLYKEVTAALSTPAAKEQFAKEATDIKQMTTAQFTKFIEDETEKWGRVIKEANIKAE